MNILLISQCKKNALKETRRIIDQFAERCGDRTWQTVMTENGLNTLHKLLRCHARKNTAVACYCTYGKNQTTLKWIVGDRQQFNQQGRVPTQRSTRNILQSHRENNWHYGTAIQIMATLGALLHDLGKATVGFQNKLQNHGMAGDPYRHEWISLHLFILMIAGCDTNESMLIRLAHFDDYQQQHPNWYQSLTSVKPQALNLSLNNVPSLGQWLAWLIVSHHRLPLCLRDERWNQGDASYHKINRDKQLQDSEYIENYTPEAFFSHLQAISQWVWNPQSEHPFPKQFWQLKQSVTENKRWLSQLSRWANKALNHRNLIDLAHQGTMSNPLLLHLSRLTLMTADYHFSSYIVPEKARAKASQLIANTLGTKIYNQELSQHLIGVAKSAAHFARILPLLTTQLPYLSNLKPFAKRTTNKRFDWQNCAYDLAKSSASAVSEAGFFGVNMASTGCGKTLGNARIISALSAKNSGVRFTIALGLRVLTLQTGKALRERLNLSDEHLAILIGGGVEKRHLIDDQFAQETSDSATSDNLMRGSESCDTLVDGDIDVVETVIGNEQLDKIISDSKAKKLLLTPLVSCTVDHLIQASECLRGGKYIVPMLRLLTADLILDEPDDFDHHDLPALARLVHLAGLLGSKVLLSSATLTPDLVAGLFNAYQAGRKIWQQQQQKSELPIICGWFDEFNQVINPISDQHKFKAEHQHFIYERQQHLHEAVVRRQGFILPIENYQTKQQPLFDYRVLANQIVKQACQLHHIYHDIDPVTQKQLSIGLVRFAHTKDVISLTHALYATCEVPNDTQLHIVVYHARQLYLLRSQLEATLDNLLNRSKPEALFSHIAIRQALDNSRAQHHLFMVISTPVTEVGRDHDYDWAIIEPSSMRSMIQLAGRVWRHRPNKIAASPNIAILGSNIKSLEQGQNYGVNTACFCKPGFESKAFLLNSHKTENLISHALLQNINAIPRIVAPDVNHEVLDSLILLEHRVMADLFNFKASTTGATVRKSNVVTSYWQPDLAHVYCGHLQLLTPFRQQPMQQDDYICQYDPYYANFCFRLAKIAHQYPDDLETGLNNNYISYQSWDEVMAQNPQVQPWLNFDFYHEVQKLADYEGENAENLIMLKLATVTLDKKIKWYYHPWFGFYEESIKL
jgi:CRISPR-associated endonuclease/helicase Cas3